MSNRSSRRDMLRVLGAGLASSCVAPWFEVLSGTALADSKKTPKNCILMWMIGGPPQSLTWDPKSGAAFQAIETSVPGVRIAENFPMIAKVMNDVSLLRGMKTGDSNHQTARYLMHTGFRRGQGGVAHPVLGSMLAKESKHEGDLPGFVSIGSPGFGGFGPGHLGPKFAPVRVDNIQTGMTDLKPSNSLQEFDDQYHLLDEMNADFAVERSAKSVQAHRVTLERAAKIMHSSKTKAFDLSSEPEKLRSAYGESQLGQSCLLARRLIESGVRFVEVRQDGWDVHKDTVDRTRKLSSALDPALATLITDLKSRRLLDDTLIICMGEFGRNPENGSNHFSRAWTTVLAGGGLKHGQAIGDTGKNGQDVTKRVISAGDFFATVAKTLTIDYGTDWTTDTGRPIAKVAKGAEPVRELFA